MKIITFSFDDGNCNDVLVGDILNIKALSDDRKYSEQIELPAKVLPDPIKATYKNGVLEVIFVYDQSNRKSIKIE